jgi:YbgC/YbaW family acyl-CoA thioester hydrolase
VLKSKKMALIDTNKQYPKRTVSVAKVRFQDCDPLMHLNNAKYFDYFFNAREDQVAEMYQFDFGDYYQKTKTTWVVYNHQIAYMSSAKISEWVQIISSIVFFNHNTKITEYVMTDQAGLKVKAVLWTTSKYIDTRTGGTAPHQPEIMELLGHISTAEVSLEPESFSQRLKTIKTQLAEGIFL